MPTQNEINRRAIDKMTRDAHKDGGAKAAEYVKRKATEAAKRQDRDKGRG